MFTLLAKPPAEPAAQTAERCPWCGGLISVVGFAPALVPDVFDSS